MSVGYSFPALSGMGVGRGIVSFGLMGGGAVEDAVVIVICLDGSVHVRISESGDLQVQKVVAGAVLLDASVASDVRERVAVSGNVRTNPTVAGLILGRC